MVQLHHDYARFRERDAEILVIAPEEVERLRDYWEREELPFAGLSDANHAVADRYGQEVKLFKGGRMPALFVVDKQGRLRFQHYGQNMGDIPRNSEVLALLDELNRG